MFRLTKKRSAKIGLPPGTLIHIGERKTEKVRIRILDYDEAQFEEEEAKTIEECFPFKDKSTITWINIDGIHQVEIIEKLGNYLCKKEGDLTEDEALGIAALLNSRLYNRYFQATNGSTQINATELGHLPFPCLDTIRRVGKLVNKLAVGNDTDREHLIIRVIKAARLSKDTI